VGRTSDITGSAESTGDGEALTFNQASFEATMEFDLELARD
jgi:hypothetical protein